MIRKHFTALFFCHCACIPAVATARSGSASGIGGSKETDDV